MINTLYIFQYFKFGLCYGIFGVMVKGSDKYICCVLLCKDNSIFCVKSLNVGLWIVSMQYILLFVLSYLYN